MVSSPGEHCAANADPGGSTPPCVSRFRIPGGCRRVRGADGRQRRSARRGAGPPKGAPSHRDGVDRWADRMDEVHPPTLSKRSDDSEVQAKRAASIRGRCTGLLNRGTRFDSEVAYQFHGAQALGLMHRVLNPGNLDRPQGASPMEGQADGRRQRSRKPPSDKPWRSAPALRLLPPLRAADVLTDIRLRSPSWRARPPPSAIHSHAWRASPISDGSWLLTSGLGHPGICRCKSCALRHLHRLDLRRYVRAAGRATREGRVPHGGLDRSRSFSTDVADWVGAGFQNQSRRVRFLSSVPSSRCPTATMPPCHGGDAGSTPAAGSISRGRLTEGCLATNQETAGSNPALEANLSW